MTIDTDLATLRHDLDRGALDRVETELARLRQERNEYAERLAWHREERDVYMKGNVWVRRAAEELERAETAERELARLQEGLRPESLARLFHETYERLAPDHGYKTREDSAVLWEDVPAANRALMIATADAVARALLADTPDHAPPDPR